VGKQMDKNKIAKQKKAYREANKDKIKAYREANYTKIPTFGSKGQRRLVYTNGMTKEITQEMVNKIKDRVFKRAIKHPERLLKTIKMNKSELSLCMSCMCMTKDVRVKDREEIWCGKCQTVKGIERWNK
jgi:hypothetical protein